MPGARCTRGLVCKTVRKKTHTSIQVQSEHSGIPRAMALRLMPCSPRRRIRLVTVADGLKVCPTRLGRLSLRQLDTSNGCRNHTVLPYAATSVVCTLCPLTDQGPPCDHHHAPDAAASTASRPTFVTMANAPLSGRDGRVINLIWGWRQAKFGISEIGLALDCRNAMREQLSALSP